MAKILRGEIRWADLNPVRRLEQTGIRPVLIISNDAFNERSGTVIALALASQPQKAGFPLTLEMNVRELKTRAWLKISQIRTLSVDRLGKKLAHIESEIIDQAIEGLIEIIGS